MGISKETAELFMELSVGAYSGDQAMKPYSPALSALAKAHGITDRHCNPKPEEFAAFLRECADLIAPRFYDGEAITYLRAIQWALGESPNGAPEFIPPGNPKGKYWWRSSLRELAELRYDPARECSVSTRIFPTPQPDSGRDKQ